jgi:branched-chain amino acid transport system substrate-binding protein
MPLVAQLVHERLGRAPLVLEQPETVVARGALVAASAGAVRFEGPVGVPGPRVGAVAVVSLEKPVDAREHGGQPVVARPARSASTKTADEPEAARRRPARAGIAVLCCLLLLAALGVLGGDRARRGTVRPPGADRLAATPNLCPVKIGFMATFSDVWAGWNAWDLYDGARLAVRLHNDRRPGCEVTITDLDTGENLDLAAARATTVAQDPAYVGLIGPMFDSEVTDAMPVLDAAGVPVITPYDIAGTRAGRTWRTYHRMLGDRVAGAAAAARYLRAMPGAPRVFVLDDHLASDRQPVVDTVTAGLGDRLAGRFTVQNHSRFIDTVANRIRSSGATVVYYCLGTADYAGALSAELAATGGGVTVVADTHVKEQTPDGRAPAAVGYVAPDTPATSTDPAFRAAFRERYGHEPSPYAAEAFDATTVLLDGIDAGHITREALLAYVDGYNGTGVTGPLRFDNGTRAGPKWWAYRTDGGTVVPDREIT